MVKWEINYDNGGWTALSGKIDYIMEELNGHVEASFKLPNTAANRAIVGSDRGLQIKFGGTEIFLGSLNAVNYTHQELHCIAYDPVLELMKKRVITADWSAGGANNIIFGSVCVAAGVPAGTNGMSGSVIALRTEAAYCYDVWEYIAKTENKDRWSQGGTAFIGVKGTLLVGTVSLTSLISERGVDRSKNCDKVLYRGTDVQGLYIEGSAGVGDNVKVFSDKKGCDLATLNKMATTELENLNKDTTGIPFRMQIEEGYNIVAGDEVAIQIDALALDGTYEVKKITKYETEVNAEVDCKLTGLDEDLKSTDQYADMGIYPISTEQLTPWSLNLQGLKYLYKNNEGTSTTATNSAPITGATNGAIVNGHWEPVGNLKVLRWDADGYISCGTEDYISEGTYFAVEVWASPVGTYADGNYLAAKKEQYILQHYGAYNKIRFGAKLNGTWAYATTIGSVMPLNSRTQVIGVYDGGSLNIYINGTLNTSTAASGSLNASAGTVFFGAGTVGAGGLNGYIGICSLWNRVISPQEVSELYFFPLNRVI
jgi:hypothetical protein